MINLKTFEYITAITFCFLGVAIALITSLNSVDYSDGQATGICFSVMLLEVLAFLFYIVSDLKEYS